MKAFFKYHQWLDSYFWVFCSWQHGRDSSKCFELGFGFDNWAIGNMHDFTLSSWNAFWHQMLGHHLRDRFWGVRPFWTWQRLWIASDNDEDWWIIWRGCVFGKVFWFWVNFPFRYRIFMELYELNNCINMIFSFYYGKEIMTKNKNK